MKLIATKFQRRGILGRTAISKETPKRNPPPFGFNRVKKSPTKISCILKLQCSFSAYRVLNPLLYSDYLNGPENAEKQHFCIRIIRRNHDITHTLIRQTWIG